MRAMFAPPGGLERRGGMTRRVQVPAGNPPGL
jgi:hypothetical protein